MKNSYSWTSRHSENPEHGGEAETLPCITETTARTLEGKSSHLMLAALPLPQAGAAVPSEMVTSAHCSSCGKRASPVHIHPATPFPKFWVTSWEPLPGSHLTGVPWGIHRLAHPESDCAAVINRSSATEWERLGLIPTVEAECLCLSWNSWCSFLPMLGSQLTLFHWLSLCLSCGRAWIGHFQPSGRGLESWGTWTNEESPGNPSCQWQRPLRHRGKAWLTPCL